MKSQVALDFLSPDGGDALERAAGVAKEVSRYVDLIEAGTPLIKSAGMGAVSYLREKHGDRIVADMKTLDVGYGEVEMAILAGAGYVSISGLAPDSTVEEAVRARDDYGKKLMVDLLGAGDVVARGTEIRDMGADYVLVHTGIDEQARGKDPLYKARRVDEEVGMPMAVARGLDPEMIGELRDLGSFEIAIVGGYITNSPDPAAAAREVQRAVNAPTGI